LGAVCCAGDVLVTCSLDHSPTLSLPRFDEQLETFFIKAQKHEEQSKIRLITAELETNQTALLLLPV
jgi:hypothetical protein